MIFFFFFYFRHNQGHLSATDLYLWQKFGLSQIFVISMNCELCLGVLLFGDCMCVAPSWFLWFVFLPSGLVSSHSPKMLDKWWFKMVIWVSVGTNNCSSVSLCSPCNRWATLEYMYSTSHQISAMICSIQSRSVKQEVQRIQCTPLAGLGTIEGWRKFWIFNCIFMFYRISYW